MNSFRTASLLISSAGFLLLAGCGSTATTKTTVPPVVDAGVTGHVFGGEAPVANATIQLYAVGTTGDGSASTALLTKPVTTDATGAFAITSDYSCTGATEVYLTATQGDTSGNTNNSNRSLMTAVGPCTGLVSGTIITVNELTTLAAVNALAPFMTAANAVGSASSDATTLTSAFTLASQFVAPTTGAAPGQNVPAGYTDPVNEINTLGDITATCVNSSGGVAGDGSACGTFFTLTTLQGGIAPTNTVAALLNLADNPTLNTAALYAIANASGPFQPMLATAPAYFKIELLPDSGTGSLQISPSSLTFAATAVGFTTAPQEITITNTGSAAISLISATVTGTTATVFNATSGCPATLAPAATCAIEITGTPTTTGSYTDSFTLVSDAPNSPQSVPLSMAATLPSAGPVTVTPSLTWLMAGATEDATLKNNGTIPLTIRGFNFDDSFFTQTNNCGTQLAAGASCVISVVAILPTTYTPGFTGSLNIDDDAALGGQDVYLSYVYPVGFMAAGFGTPAAPLTGPFPVGVPVQGYMTFSYLRDTPLTGSFTGADASDFSYTPDNTCTSGSCYTVSFTFTPGAAGLRTAQFVPGGNGNCVLDPCNDTGAEYIPLSAFAGTVSGGALTITPASITFPSSIVDFGSDVQTATITNSGSAPVSLGSIAVAGANAGDFLEQNACPATLAAGASCAVNITATPQALGVRTATLTVVSNAAVATQPEQLAVTGVAATAGPVSLSASTLTYDIAGLLQDVTLNNNGTSPLLISSVRYFDTSAPPTGYLYTPYGPGNFSVYANGCGTILAAGASCTLTVQSEAGGVDDNGTDFPITYTGEIMIVDNASAGPQTVSLTSTSTSYFAPTVAFPADGVGFTETLAPITYNFYTVYDGYPALDFTYGGADPADFSSTATYEFNPVPYCPGAQSLSYYNCTVTFSFTPGASGARSAKAFVDGEPEYVLLTGSGIGSGPSFTVAQTSISVSSELPLAPDPYSVSDATAVLSITNSGTTTLNFVVTYSGINPAEMSFYPGTCASLAPGATCTASVTYTPTAAGEYATGNVVVTDSASGFARTIPITVQSAYWPVVATPSGLSFSSPAAGTTSAPQAFVLADPHGYPLGEALTASISGGNGSFVLTQGSSCPASIVQTCTLAVAFSPTATGDFTAYLDVTDEASGLITPIELYGAAGSPAVFLSPNPLVFTAQSVGTSSATTYVSLTNTGTQPLGVSSVTLSGTSSSSFSQTNNCVTTLVPNSSCDIGVIFNPAATGPLTASLQIVSNAASSPNTVTLSGTGQ